ncbi:MAG TPA: S41 family peptidase [bacterium]|nr:S41 family peptidase [bacterium]
MRTRSILAILAVLLAATLAVPPGLLLSARAADAGIVYEVLAAIVENHVDRPDPAKLLAGAVTGLRDALTRAGVTPQIPDLTATTESEARTEFQARFDQAVAQAAGRLQDVQLRYAAASAMAASLDDSHTWFLNPQQWREFVLRTQGNPSFVGIGVLLLTKDGRFYIWRVFPGSPAERAGLQTFDRIVGVDGQTIQDLPDLVNRVRGPEGTQVSITVQRPGQTAPVTVSVTRAPITVPVETHRVLANQIGYLEITGFTTGAAVRVRAALEDLRGRGIRGLVLDLRRNSGGSLNEVVDVANLLLPANLTVYTLTTRQGSVQGITSGGTVLDPSVPIVALTDEGTASGGELLSAALQEHGRAQVVGTQTAGALLVGRLFGFTDGSGMSITIAKITTGKGATLEKNGARPNFEIALTAADLDRGADPQLARAVQLLSGAASR